MKTTKKSNLRTKIFESIKTMFMLSFVIPFLSACKTIKGNQTPCVVYAFREATYDCKRVETLRDNTPFSFEGASFVVEKSSATPKNGQIVTSKDPNQFNGSLLIAFKDCVLESIVFDEPERNELSSFYYKFDYEGKSYEMIFGAHSAFDDENIDVEICDRDNLGCFHGSNDYFIKGTFSLRKTL